MKSVTKGKERRNKTMRLRLERIALKSTYTIGHLYYIAESGSKVYICDVIEDKVRDLNKNGKFDPPTEVKIKGQTAIPYGTYEVAMNTRSPKFSNFAKYPYAKKYNGYMPRLLRVPQFEGILIHPGSSANSSAGCLIVGYNKVVGRVVDSQKAFNYLMDKYLVPNRAEKITIEIV